MNARPPHARLEYITVFVFALALILPSLGLIGRGSAYLVTEKRPVAVQPAWHLSTWLKATWQKQAEKFLSDRFLGRTGLIAANAWIHADVLHTAPNASVAIGRDGWLYYTDEHTMDDVRGVSPLTSVQLAALRQRILGLNNIATAAGSTFALFIAPNTGTIYPEHLTADRRSGETTRFDQLVTVVGRDVPLIDPRVDLLNAKGMGQLYYQTDSHWSNVGAFIATQDLLDWMKVGQPAKMSDFTRQEFTGYSGDLIPLMGIPWKTNDMYYSLRPTAITQVMSSTKLYIGVSLSRPAVVKEINNPGLPTAVIFCDSYSNAMVQFLAPHFRRVVFVRSRTVIPEILAAEKPTFTVLEVAERYISTIGTATNAGEKALSY